MNDKKIQENSTLPADPWESDARISLEKLTNQNQNVYMRFKRSMQDNVKLFLTVQLFVFFLFNAKLCYLYCQYFVIGFYSSGYHICLHLYIEMCMRVFFIYRNVHENLPSSQLLYRSQQDFML